VDEETYRDEGGNTYHVSISTEQLMPYHRNLGEYQAPTVEQIQEQIAHLEANPPQKPEDSCWEVLRHVVKARKATHWINSCVGGLGFPVTGPTDEIAYLNLALHPELHGPVAELTAKSCMAVLPWYAEEGVDSVMPCADLGSSTALFANPRILRDHCEPWWAAYINRAHELGLKVILHSCGCNWEALPSICSAGYDGYEAVQGSASMDLKRVKELYGDKLTLWSGIWNEHLILGSPADIEADAKHALRWAAPGGGFIYGATHSLAMGTKPANLEMMKACRERWGAYPINVPE
jgi:uroporphyrinogen-III decarboxylase